MHVFVVLALVFSLPSQEIGLGKSPRNDLFCVEWDIKPQLSQSHANCCHRLSVRYKAGIVLKRLEESSW